MNYNESLEMYLETIYVLSEKSNTVKSIDVANELNYARASVSRAIKLLIETASKKLPNPNSYENDDILTKYR